MGNLVIAIGRQHGSGGRYIGEQLAERLGIKCYNSELITETAVKGGFAQQYIAENEERRPQSLLFSLVMGYGSPESQPVALRLFTEQSKVIKEIAERLEFSNEYNFSRFFRRLNACSPSAWRQHRYAAGFELKFGKNI